MSHQFFKEEQIWLILISVINGLAYYKVSIKLMICRQVKFLLLKKEDLKLEIKFFLKNKPLCINKLFWFNIST